MSNRLMRMGSEAERQCQVSQCINDGSQYTNERSDESISVDVNANAK